MTTSYRFTFAGIIALGALGLLLAANDKTGPAVIFVLLLMILLLVVVNYRQTLSVFFTKS